MITSALLQLLTTLVNGLYATLPPWSIAPDTLSGPGGGNIMDTQSTVTQTQSGLQMLFVWMQKYNNFLPIDQLLIIITTIATFYGVMIIYKGVRLIIGIIRGAGTS